MIKKYQKNKYKSFRGFLLTLELIIFAPIIILILFIFSNFQLKKSNSVDLNLYEYVFTMGKQSGQSIEEYVNKYEFLKIKKEIGDYYILELNNGLYIVAHEFKCFKVFSSLKEAEKNIDELEKNNLSN
jgi:hypothetical protein